MRLKIRVLLAIGCASVLAISIPALSAPAPRGAAHQQSSQHPVHKKIVQHTRARHAKRQPVRDNRGTRLASMPVTEKPQQPAFGWPVLVREARKYIGTNPTARARLWCATFMNLVLAKVGYAGTNSDAARSFATYGHRIPEPRVGAIAVLTRGKTGGHVGVVSGVDANGNPIIISGNHGRSVGEATYPRSRVIAYVMPTDRGPASETRVAERATPIAPATTNTLSAVSRPSTENSIDSPISEFVTTIEAERSRPEAAARPAQRVPEPTTPQRSVQQLPERAQPVARHATLRHAPPATRPARRVSRHDLPLDPALAKLFGIKARAQAAPPRRHSASR